MVVRWVNIYLMMDVNSISKSSSIQYILEFDLEYPDKLHELNNDYPLAPERLEVSHNILPKYCSRTANKYDIKIDSANNLVPNLGNSSNYYTLLKVDLRDA